jgi:hypothetical protein
VLLLATPAVPFAVSAQQKPSSAPQSSAAQWRRAEKPEPNRGRILIQFTLTGKFLTSPRSAAQNRPALLVSCVPDRHDESEGKYSDAQLLVGSALKIDFVEPPELNTGTSYNQEVSVQFRLNDGKAGEKQWMAGADKSSASIPKDVVKEMLRAHTVVMTVREKDAGEVEMQFDMPDPTQVEKACGIGSR